jgi:predicted SnoaL-like aldol condensation-catalyzing enzyme
MEARSKAEQHNLELVLAMFANVLRPLDAASVDHFISADYVQHSALAGGGREGLKAFLERARRETPHAVHDIKRSFVDGDHVIVHYHVRRAPTDAGFAVMDIFRVAGEQIVEHWDVIQPVVADGPNPNSMF